MKTSFSFLFTIFGLVKIISSNPVPCLDDLLQLAFGTYGGALGRGFSAQNPYPPPYGSPYYSPYGNPYGSPYYGGSPYYSGSPNVNPYYGGNPYYGANLYYGGNTDNEEDFF